jgi:hypothetical protein
MASAQGDVTNFTRSLPMLRVRFSVLALVPALALAACGEVKPSNESARDQVSQAMPAPSLSYAGTFTRTTPRIGGLTQLVLKTDGTYHRATLVVCFREPCDPVQQDGLFRFSQEATRTYLDFYEMNSEQIERYDYSLHGDIMTLHAAGRPGEEFTMQRAPVAWCASAADCAVQNLAVGPCAGQYVCGRNMCNYQCGPVPEIAGAPLKARSGS